MPLASHWQYLIELPGLSVEFWGLVLTHNHQHRTGWTHRPRWSHLQALPWAVSLSIFPGGERVEQSGYGGHRPQAGAGDGQRADNSQGHVQRGILGGSYDGLQVIDPAHQEEACVGEKFRPGTHPPTLQVSTLVPSLSSSCSIHHPSSEGKSCLVRSQTLRNLKGWMPAWAM